MSSDVRDGAGEGAAAPERGDSEAAVVQAYEEAKLRYIRSITADAETKLRDAFARRRDEINEEIANLKILAKTRQDAANAAAAAYGAKLPSRVRNRTVRPPTLWDRLRTFNSVSSMYAAASRAADELDEANEMLRKRRDRLDQMERETRRSIYLREEAVRKKLQTPEGLTALHADPLVKAAFARMQSVMNERAKWDEKVSRGEVSPQEARDREMQRRGISFAQIPMVGALIVGIARFGKLEYYAVRDLQNRLSYLSADPALEALRDAVFDLSKSAEGWEAGIHNNPDGTGMRALDHYKACFSSSDASEYYRQHRMALRTDLVTAKTPPRDAAEAELIAVLGMLAKAVADQASSSSAPEE